MPSVTTTRRRIKEIGRTSWPATVVTTRAVDRKGESSDRPCNIGAHGLDGEVASVGRVGLDRPAPLRSVRLPKRQDVPRLLHNSRLVRNHALVDENPPQLMIELHRRRPQAASLAPLRRKVDLSRLLHLGKKLNPKADGVPSESAHFDAEELVDGGKDVVVEEMGERLLLEDSLVLGDRKSVV